jgi:hypothetical protein
MKNNLLAERLNVQPLTEEEKQQRHILGRLFGPIATCLESTRNGRKYNRDLWERALADEIFKEKVSNKCLFLELGHPADREEIDMTKVCACIPEMPKIIDGDLCASVDILDTPNGKILKTLCDYGFVPGISSRGSGDIMENNEVDPETFFLECFDIVSIPAVKKARLNMCESLATDGVKLKKALAESYRAAKDEDKDTMKQALENLNINIDEELADTAEKKPLTADDIPWDPDAEEILTEEMPAEEEPEEEAEVVEEDDGIEDVEDEVIDDETDESEEVIDDEVQTEEQIVDVNAEDEVEIETVGDAIEMLQEYDDDMRVEFEAVNVDGKEYPVEKIGSFVDDEGEEEILVLGVDCGEANEGLASADIDIEAIEDSEASVEAIEEVDEENTEAADDDGDEEMIESLKEMIRQKEALETEVKALRNAKSVGDAKEQELQEKLTRYRTAFKNTSAEAAKVPELQAKIQELTEQLTQSKTTIKTLTEKVNNARQLKESVEGSKANEKRLNEEVSRLTKQSKTLEAKLEGQTKIYTEKLQERTNLAKSYKARFIETLTRYVESKASMLGVKPSEITSRLNESYTLADVDAVCDQILDSTVNFSRLPFGGRSKASARISESVVKNNYGYEVEDDLSDLYELAGLKR